jgi:transposase
MRRHQDEQVAGSGLDPDERARLNEVEVQNAKLRVERDLLKP